MTRASAPSTPFSQSARLPARASCQTDSKRWRMSASSAGSTANQRVSPTSFQNAIMSFGVTSAQHAQSLAEAFGQGGGLCTPLLLLVDDLFRGARHELCVVQLGVNLADFGLRLGQFLLQPRALFGEINDIAQWNGGRGFAQHKLR